MSPAFLLAALLVVAVPGTGVVYTLTAGLRGGRTHGVLAALGCTLSLLPHLAVATLVVGGALDALPAAIGVVRFVGAAYLGWLGVQLVRHGAFRAAPGGDGGPDATAVVADGRTIVVRGVLLNLLNPKLVLFFLAFLPQFVPPDGDPVSSTLVMSAAFVAISGVVFVGYALAAGSLSARLLSSPRRTRRATSVLGGSMVALAVQLAASA